MAKLDPETLTTRLASLEGWSVEGRAIEKVFSFEKYMDGVTFVTQIAPIAEEANHHPDIFLGWRRVRLNLSTHSEGGLTDKDFDLAEKIDRIPSP